MLDSVLDRGDAQASSRAGKPLKDALDSSHLRLVPTPAHHRIWECGRVGYAMNSPLSGANVTRSFLMPPPLLRDIIWPFKGEKQTKEVFKKSHSSTWLSWLCFPSLCDRAAPSREGTAAGTKPALEEILVIHPPVLGRLGTVTGPEPPQALLFPFGGQL